MACWLDYFFRGQAACEERGGRRKEAGAAQVISWERGREGLVERGGTDWYNNVWN